jgi:hypothetical protein
MSRITNFRSERREHQRVHHLLASDDFELV